jgi:hypothetical protein
MFQTRVTVFSARRADISTCDDTSGYRVKNLATGNLDSQYNVPANQQYLYEIWRMTRLGAHWAIDEVTPSCSPTPAPSPASLSHFDPCKPGSSPRFEPWPPGGELCPCHPHWFWPGRRRAPDCRTRGILTVTKRGRRRVRKTPAAYRSAMRPAPRVARRPTRRLLGPTRPAPGLRALPCCRSARRSGRRWSARR